jgi:hypothetical protein
MQLLHSSKVAPCLELLLSCTAAAAVNCILPPSPRDMYLLL